MEVMDKVSFPVTPASFLASSSCVTALKSERADETRDSLMFGTAIGSCFSSAGSGLALSGCKLNPQQNHIINNTLK